LTIPQCSRARPASTNTRPRLVRVWQQLQLENRSGQRGADGRVHLRGPRHRCADRATAHAFVQQPAARGHARVQALRIAGARLMVACVLGGLGVAFLAHDTEAECKQVASTLPPTVHPLLCTRFVLRVSAPSVRVRVRSSLRRPKRGLSARLPPGDGSISFAATLWRKVPCATAQRGRDHAGYDPGHRP